MSYDQKLENPNMMLPEVPDNVPEKNKKAVASVVEFQVNHVMGLNRHERRALGARNWVKIPSDKNYVLRNGKLVRKDQLPPEEAGDDFILPN